MKKPFLLIGMALIFAGFILPIPLKVSWTEGSILVKTGSEWKPLEIGTTADSSSVIQLKKDSFVEFTYAGGKLVLSAEGIYTLDKLLANGINNSRNGQPCYLRWESWLLTKFRPLPPWQVFGEASRTVLPV